jgi:hypothetical protein
VTAIPAYCGLFNSGGGEVEIAADEVAAMTFSDFMPVAGAWYDEHHSIVIAEPGIYEIDFCLRAVSTCCGMIQTSITNDGMIIPSSALTATFNPHEAFDLCGFTFAEIRSGAHLHFIVYSKDGAKFRLNDGVNLILRAKKIADAPGSQPPVEPMPL